MIPDFAGVEIADITVEYGVHLATAEPRWDFTLTEPVLITTAGEGGPYTTTFDPDVPAQEPPDALSGLSGASIVQVLVSREGALSLQFSDRHLTVAPSSQYEAWQLTGPGGERFICLPDGELAHFSPAPASDGPGAEASEARSAPTRSDDTGPGAPTDPPS